VSLSSIANVCWRACKSHPIIRISASFGPSSVRVNAETVYSGRREAGLVKTSIRRYRRIAFPSQQSDKFVAFVLGSFGKSGFGH
jgi:hypothetical protein